MIFSRRSICAAFLIAAAAPLLGASGAGAATIFATPSAGEQDLNDILAADGYSHAGSIADLNANQSLSEIFGSLANQNSFTLVIEEASGRDLNELGIYSFLDNSLREVIFAGSDSALSSASLVFGVGGIETINGSVVASGFGSEFGFYLRNRKRDFIWFSEQSRNTDGFDHFVAFEENNVLWGAFEDTPDGGDGDYNDHVFSMRGISGSANPIPEPTAGLLFATGMLVVSQARRERR